MSLLECCLFECFREGGKGGRELWSIMEIGIGQYGRSSNLTSNLKVKL